MVKGKITTLIAAALVLLTTTLNAEESRPIQWWPRIRPAVMPTNLKQLAILEFAPELKCGGETTVEVVLPDGIKYLGCPTAWINPRRPNVHSLPFPERTAYADNYLQDGNKLSLHFPAGSFEKTPQTFLPMLLDVNTTPGEYNVKVTFKSPETEYCEDIELVILDELDPTPCVKPLIVWDYQGTDEEYLPIFLNGFTTAGFNRFYGGREELKGKKSSVDFQKEFNTEHGVALSLDAVPEYFRENPLPETVAALIDEADCGWMVDNPDSSRIMIKEYLDFASAGKPFQYVILDCERGAFKSNGTRIVNDLTKYNRERFARRYQLEAVPTPEDIATKYRDEWIDYSCNLTTEYATMFNNIVREIMPGCRYEVYSGYQYSNGDTRQTYAVDWSELTDCGMDAAGAGYFGSRKDIEATAEAIASVPLIPAEMYMENFNTPGIPMPRLNVGEFAYRLIETYLWGGCNGMQIWHGGVVTGAGLASINIFKNFVNATSPIVDGAEAVPVEEALKVMPKVQEENVYTFRKDGKLAAIVLNPTAKDAVMRVSMKEGGRPKTLKMKPYSYEVLEFDPVK